MNRSGRHFLQIPGPTNVPDRILRAIEQPTIDHRSSDFKVLCREVLDGLMEVFKTSRQVLIFPASGTGAWEAALVNTLSPGDRVLMFETGHFGTLWMTLAERLGLQPHWISGSWREGVDPRNVEELLMADKEREIRAVCVVHNETSTGVTTDIAGIKNSIDRTGHPALFMVDTISSLASMDYRHEEWKVDVTVAGSQKGLMLPPGLSFNALSAKAIETSKNAGLPRAYWNWEDMLKANEQSVFPYTPATNLLYGLKEALIMLREEGLENVFTRHRRLGDATRQAVRSWGLELNALNSNEYSNSLTAVRVPEGHDADQLRKVVLENFNVSLGNGLGEVQGRVFRIGHLGDFNEPMLIGTLGAIEMGLQHSGIPFKPEGMRAAMDQLLEEIKGS